jgi:glycosyltransferase involved in cell wall biosynthesis
MDFSVVVPFYGAEPYIEQCIEGLLGQEYPADRFEILMVDNNSPDGSAGIVRQHPRLSLLSEPMQGAYAARNRGARAAQGAVIAFTDPDCVAHPDWLSCLAEALSNARISLVVGPSHPSGKGRCMRLLGEYEAQKEHYILTSSDPTLYWGHTNNMAVRKAVWESCGPFMERDRGADVLFVRRVVDAQSCEAVQYVPAAHVTHLEIDSIRAYFRKVFIYARSHQGYRTVGNARALTGQERIRVFRQTIVMNSLSHSDSLLLFQLLLIGQCCWYAGALGKETG